MQEPCGQLLSLLGVFVSDLTLVSARVYLQTPKVLNGLRLSGKFYTLIL